MSPWFEEMFCYSGNGQLSIKTGDFPVHQQKLQAWAYTRRHFSST